MQPPRLRPRLRITPLTAVRLRTAASSLTALVLLPSRFQQLRPFSGRILRIKTIAAQTVVCYFQRSSSGGGAAGTG